MKDCESQKESWQFQGACDSTVVLSFAFQMTHSCEIVWVIQGSHSHGEAGNISEFNE